MSNMSNNNDQKTRDTQGNNPATSNQGSNPQGTPQGQNQQRSTMQDGKNPGETGNTPVTDTERAGKSAPGRQDDARSNR